MRRATIGLAILLVGWASAAGRAQTAPPAQIDPEIVRVRVGLGGRYKVGLWTPVAVTLRGGRESLTGTVVLTVPDGDDVPAQVFSPPGRPCQVLPGQETTVLLHARFGRTDSQCLVQFVVDSDVVAERKFDSYLGAEEEGHYPPAIEATRKLIVEIGAVSTGASEAAALAPETPENQPEVVRLTDVEQMPTRWYGYEGVDAVVIATSRPEIFQKLVGGSNARLDALDRWIRMGGRLVLLVGEQGSEILDETGPWARFAPGKLAGMQTLPPPAALEAHAGGSHALKAGETSLRMPRLTLPGDETMIEVVREVDLPLVVRAPRGFGQVVFVATDLDRAPWNGWRDRGRLMARLLGLPTQRDNLSNSPSAPLMVEGYNDISGHLRSCLDQFTGVRPVPFGAVVGGVLLYILLVGPGDYFLLRRLKRFEWTWFTFPILVVVFCAVAYGLAYWFKGDQLRVNQVDLVDVDVPSGFVRGTSWAEIFSPRMETYNLSLRPNLPGETPDARADVLFSWFGMPGEGLGGMGSSSAGVSRWRRTYSFSPELDAMHGAPIQVWSTKSVTGRYSTQWSKAIQADLRDKGGLPVGTLSHALDFPLEKGLLVYDRWVYELGTVAPNQLVRIDAVQKRAELRTLLTGRRRQSDEQGEQTTAYDRSRRDADYVLREMMFYAVTGGKQYTKLSNGYQSFVDMSDLLSPGRAVLVGFASGTKHPGAELLRDGQSLASPQDQRLTAFRFLLPVKSDQGPRPPRKP